MSRQESCSVVGGMRVTGCALKNIRHALTISDPMINFATKTMENYVIFSKLNNEISKYRLIEKEVDSVQKYAGELIGKLKDGEEVDRNVIKGIYLNNIKFVMLASEMRGSIAKMTVMKELLGSAWDSKDNTLSESEKRDMCVIIGAEMPVFRVDGDHLVMSAQFSSEYLDLSVDKKIPHDKEQLRKIADSFINQPFDGNTQYT